MTYHDFHNKWLGKRVDYDGVFQYQCVDLIKQYLAECHGIQAGTWGDAKQYWLKTNPALLSRFDRVSGISPKAGDIVILMPTSSNPYGHIAIAHDHAYMLEQNGSTGSGSGLGKDAIRLRAIPYDRMYGVLRPKLIGEPPMTAEERSYYNIGRQAQADNWIGQIQSLRDNVQGLSQKTVELEKLHIEQTAKQNELNAQILALTNELNNANKTILTHKRDLPVPSQPVVIEQPKVKKPSILVRMLAAIIRNKK